jgi:citronellol/citronellal dehydrogenase
MELTVKTLGGIDLLINDASAIRLAGTLETTTQHFDLMCGVNVRATYLCSRLAIPDLMKAGNPHSLTLSPRLNMQPNWFGLHVAYTMSKYGMSM